MATALGAAPISQDWPDTDLVAAVRRGSDTAFEELYSRYSHRIGAYVRGMVGDHGRAEDITQEIFIAALRRMRETARPIAFKPWIYEIAKNACIDSFRRTRRAQEVSLDAGDRLSTADRGRLTVVTTPDAAFDSKQALQDLQGAFGGLSASHHEILVLRELEGRSYSDIGERLGMSRPVVESTLFRARRRLAEEYDELTSGRRCEFVRNMVDSGPQYSLGIRDRRRIARHLAHCQACRGHARAADFDESILNMPGIATRIAALFPFPLAFLRDRWDAVGRMGVGRGRPPLLALRSVHTLAGSSDQIVGASAAGRGAATAAALVLAGVGGGLVTASSTKLAHPPHRSALHASARRAPAIPAVSIDRIVALTAKARTPAVKARKLRATSSHARSTRLGLGLQTGTVAGSSGGASTPHAAAGSTPPTAAPTAGGAGSATPAGTGGAVSPTSTGADPGSGPTPPSGADATGTLSTTLGDVVGAVPQAPSADGTIDGSGPAAPDAGTIGAVGSGLSQLLGNS